MPSRKDTKLECLGIVKGSDIFRVEQGDFGFQAWARTKTGTNCRYRVEKQVLLDMFKGTQKFIAAFGDKQTVPRLLLP